MGLTQKLGTIPLAVFTDSSNNVGIGGAANASYKLQVTGATNLTGALTGTSASFSSSVTAAGSIFIGTNFAQLLPITALNSQFLTGSYYDGSNIIATAASGTRTIYNSGGFDFRNFTGATIGSSVTDTSRLTIASTGAATFSSSVTATSGIYNPIDNAADTIRVYRGNTAPYLNESAIFDAGGGMTNIRNKSLDTVRSIIFSFSTDGSTSYTERMRITSGGSLGLGTTSPFNPGGGGQTSFEMSGTNYSTIYLSANSATVRGQIGADNLNAWVEVGARTNHPLLLITNNTERMRITSGGLVGIGNTGVGTVRLAVTGENQSSSNYSFISYDSAGNPILVCRNDRAVFFNSFVYGNTVSGGTRNLYIDNTYAIGGISSIRASKKNIEEFDSQWIYDLQPVQFNYRKKDKNGNYTEDVFDELTYGLIAEDTEPIADFLINYNDKEDGTKEMVGIEYMRLITPMLKAIQELEARIKQLENK